MEWFDEITQNPFLEWAILVDLSGNLVMLSGLDDEPAQQIAVMLESIQVLAGELGDDFEVGELEMLELGTSGSHLLLLRAGGAHFLAVLTRRTAPLELTLQNLRRAITRMPQPFPPRADTDDWNTDSLIDAVSEWLHNGGDSTSE